MENKQRSDTEDVSSANAVLLGALAPGVNGPTWNTLKFAFLMLGLCLAAMLGLAFSSSDIGLILHVTLLFLITGTLFILLTSGYACELAWKRCELGCPVGIWKCIFYLCLAILAGILNMCETGVAPMLQGFLAETGLVSVEHQMQEMGLAPKDSAAINKKSS